MNTTVLRIFLSNVGILGLCICVSYIFMRGLLGVLYEFTGWVVRVLD